MVENPNIHRKPFFKRSISWIIVLSVIIIVFLIVESYNLFESYVTDDIKNQESSIKSIKQDNEEDKLNQEKNHYQNVSYLNALLLKKNNSLIQNNKLLIEKLKKDIEYLNYQLSDQPDEINLQEMTKTKDLTKKSEMEIQIDILNKEINNIREANKNIIRTDISIMKGK